MSRFEFRCPSGPFGIVRKSAILGRRHQLKRPVLRGPALKLAVLTGAEIDRPAHLATAFFAAQTSEEFRKGEIAAPLGKQAHGVNGFSLAAMQLQEAVGPVKQAMIWEEAEWVHPPIFLENKTRTIAKADVAGDLKLWTAKGGGVALPVCPAHLIIYVLYHMPRRKP